MAKAGAMVVAVAMAGAMAVAVAMAVTEAVAVGLCFQVLWSKGKMKDNSQNLRCSQTDAPVLVYGSLNVDYVYRVPHFLQPGETLHSLDRNVYAGGKGLNQAVALRRAGAQVRFLGAVGSQDGQLLVDTLKNEDIDLSLLKVREDMASGHTFIQVDLNGQNCIMLYAGANHSHSRDEIVSALDGCARGSWAVVQNETNDVAFFVEQAAARGVNVAINVSPLGPQIDQIPLEKCRVIIVNEIEGAALSGHGADDNPDEMMASLRARFPNSLVVITLGTSGSLAADGNGDDSPVCCAAFKADAVDTTAAGDTFFGYFIKYLSCGNAVAESLTAASAASAIAVTRSGAAPSIPIAAETAAFLESHKQ